MRLTADLLGEGGGGQGGGSFGEYIFVSQMGIYSMNWGHFFNDDACLLQKSHVTRPKYFLIRDCGRLFRGIYFRIPHGKLFHEFGTLFNDDACLLQQGHVTRPKCFLIIRD